MLYNSLEHNKIGSAIKQKTLADARISYDPVRRFSWGREKLQKKAISL